MEVVNEVSGEHESRVEIGEDTGIKVITKYLAGRAVFVIDSITSDCYIAESNGIEMNPDRAQHYHELLTSKVIAFIGEIEAVMKEIDQ